MVVSSEVLLRWTGGEYVRGDGTFFSSPSCFQLTWISCLPLWSWVAADKVRAPEYDIMQLERDMAKERRSEDGGR